MDDADVPKIRDKGERREAIASARPRPRSGAWIGRGARHSPAGRRPDRIPQAGGFPHDAESSHALSVLALSAAAPRPGRARAGRRRPARSELFKANCAKCHGDDGKGQTEEGKKKGARDLSNAKWQATISDERMIRSITRGRDMMPAFGKGPTPEQIKELVKEVRALAARP